jgi:hypothetical protein
MLLRRRAAEAEEDVGRALALGGLRVAAAAADAAERAVHCRGGRAMNGELQASFLNARTSRGAERALPKLFEECFEVIPAVGRYCSR